MPKPICLVILDGWGHNPNPEHNAIAAAQTPHWDALATEATCGLLSGSGKCVGLPDGQMGNSEVGHMNIGAGRVVLQDLPKINQLIENKQFFENDVLCRAIDDAAQSGQAVHVMGLVSPGGVHSHQDHIQALCRLAQQKGANRLYLHAFLDGRDCPPCSAEPSLAAFEDLFTELGMGQIASITGRYYAMDRDKRWARTSAAYDALVRGQAEHHATSALAGLEAAYARDETDEFVSTTLIYSQDATPATISSGDVVIFMNFRADRARQLTRALISPDFNEFDISDRPKLSHFVSLTEYAADLPTEVAFTKDNVQDSLGECVSRSGMKQLRIAETEKYAHVTFFFNGGVETVFPGEDRNLIPSPKVATYDLQPQMSAPELTQRLCEAIENDQYDMIICNYANPDMVGHTGDFDAAVKAVECIDNCIGKLCASLDKAGGEMIITADHGNVECMFDESTGQAHTAHTTALVPFIYRGRTVSLVREVGALCDLAPTMLSLLGLEIPQAMKGESLLRLE